MNSDFRQNRLVWHNKEYVREVFRFAKKTNQTKNLKRSLQQLRNIAKNRGSNWKVFIGKDFAPFSFTFVIRLGPSRALDGGIIYHGSHDGGGNGSGPTFSVCLEPTQGWSIHT